MKLEHFKAVVQVQEGRCGLQILSPDLKTVQLEITGYLCLSYTLRLELPTPLKMLF